MNENEKKNGGAHKPFLYSLDMFELQIEASKQKDLGCDRCLKTMTTYIKPNECRFLRLVQFFGFLGRHIMVPGMQNGGT